MSLKAFTLKRHISVIAIRTSGRGDRDEWRVGEHTNFSAAHYHMHSHLPTPDVLLFRRFVRAL